jgi:hypothetical protein
MAHSGDVIENPVTGPGTPRLTSTAPAMSWARATPSMCPEGPGTGSKLKPDAHLVCSGVGEGVVPE